MSSTPANGAQVIAPPTEVNIRYSEGVQLGEARVVEAAGARVDAGDIKIAPEDRTLVTVPLQQLGDGLYTLNWQMLAEDGHTTKGSIFFIVGPEMPSRERFIELLTRDSGGGGQVSPAEPPLRGLIFLALAVLLGLPLMLLLLVQPALRASGLEDERLRQRVRRFLAIAAAALAVGAVGLAVSQIAMANGSVDVDGAATFVGTTSSGRIAVARLVLSGALLLVLWLAPWRLVWLVGAALVALVAEGSISWASHSATLVGGIGPTLSDLGHLLGGAVWAGGLVVLAVVVPAVLPGQQIDKAGWFTARVIRRFSALAIGAVALAVATGLLLASFHVPTWGALLSTLYGASLSLKLALLLGAIALGAWHKLWVQRRLAVAAAAGEGNTAREVERFVRSVRVELLLVVAIFFLSGLLTSAPTANTAVAQRDSHAPHTESERVRDLDVRLTTTPHQVGLNVFDVRFDREGTPSDDVRDANLLMRQPDAEVYLPQTRLDPVQAGLYSALGSFTLPGRWEVRASAFVDGRFTAYTFTTDVADSGAERALPTDPFFQGALRLAALLVAVAGLLALGWEFIAQRRQAE